MSLFGNIVDKIVHYAEGAVGAGSGGAAQARPPAPDMPSPAVAASAVPSDGAPGPAAGSAAPATTLSAVDIGAVLGKRAAASGQTLHWQTSIVDLLKLLDLDSSLDARKQLATELDVHAGADGSAEQNEALHRAVVAKLEANGGNIPAEMKG